VEGAGFDMIRSDSRIAGIVFSLRFASRIGGRRMSVICGFGKPVHAGLQHDPDFFKQGGFHRRQTTHP